MSFHAPVRAGPAAAKASPHRRLLRALLDMAGLDAAIACASMEPWASLLFEGQRHLIDIGLSGESAVAQAATLRRTLPEAEFRLQGHIVADLSIDGERVGHDADGLPYVLLRLSVLTIEDW